MPEQPFVHLHAHTDYSLLDGCAAVDRYMERCKELNMPALAITDHGNLFGAIEFYKAAKKAGVKALIGCEIYLVYDHAQAEKPKRDRQRSDDINDVPEDELGPDNYPKFQIHHKTLIAQNFTGYQNLVKLVSDAHVNGMYYRPRTDMAKLAAHSEGIIGLSGCINGVAAQHLIYNDYAGAREATARFVEIFGRERYFIELQNHGMPVQVRIIPGLLKLAKEFDLRVVAANDVHYVLKEDAYPHDALLCIQTGKIIKDADRMRYPNHEFYLKSHSEMAAIFGEIPGALENTVAVAEMVDLKIPTNENHYPRYERDAVIEVHTEAADFERILDIYEREKNKIQAREKKDPIKLSPEKRAEFQKNGRYLFDLCKQGLEERYGVPYDAFRRSGAVPEGIDAEHARRVCDQLDYELAIITGAGFVDYFLIVWDFIHWARTQGIPVGPGRGSGAGCVVAYVLKITDIDPLRFGLLFERMLNLERVSPPDFDVDFCMRRRDDVVAYVRGKYGADKVANIITYGTFGAKAVVRDLARVLDVQFTDANRIAKLVPDDINITLDEALAKSADFKAECARNPVVQEIVKQGKVIEGMVRNTGKHACGIIIGDQTLTNLVPVTLQEGDLTTQYAKGPVEELGLLKCDFLGLKTLTVIADAEAHVRRLPGMESFDIEKVPLDDPKTYELLNSGQTTGVFQLESGGMQALCRQIGLSKFEEIIALIALYRPGPMQFIPQFIEGKKDPSKVQVPHPLLKELVSETYGVLVYQEQVMQAAQIIAGYTLGGADQLRRAMGKKKPEEMATHKSIFIEGAKATHGLSEKVASEIFAILEKFAQYGFNKSHSAAYAMLSYRTAYLKANYPVEFMAGVLGCELGNAEKVAHFIGECGQMGVQVLGPDVNISGVSFTPVREADGGSAIRFGLGGIKGVGDLAAQAIRAEGRKAGPYKDLSDFAKRLDGQGINRRVFENLIKAGALDGFGEDRAELLDALEGTLREVQELQKDKASGQTNLFDLFEAAAPVKSTGKVGATKRARKQMPMGEKLQLEKELLGFYVSGHPMAPYRGVAEGLDSFQGEDFKKMANREPFRLCGVLTGVEKKTSKKDGRSWAILQVSTLLHTHAVNAFADAFETINKDFPALLAEGQLVCVEGQVLHRQDGDIQLALHKAVPLDSVVPGLVRGLTFVVDPNPRTEGFIELLRSEIEPQMGKTKVELGFLVDPGQILVAEVASSLTWEFNKDTYARIRAHPAVRDVLVTAPSPETPPSKWERERGSLGDRRR